MVDFRPNLADPGPNLAEFGPRSVELDPNLADGPHSLDTAGAAINIASRANIQLCFVLPRKTSVPSTSVGHRRASAEQGLGRCCTIHWQSVSGGTHIRRHTERVGGTCKASKTPSKPRHPRRSTRQRKARKKDRPPAPHVEAGADGLSVRGPLPHGFKNERNRALQESRSWATTGHSRPLFAARPSSAPLGQVVLVCRGSPRCLVMRSSISHAKHALQFQHAGGALPDGDVPRRSIRSNVGCHPRLAALRSLRQRGACNKTWADTAARCCVSSGKYRHLEGRRWHRYSSRSEPCEAEPGQRLRDPLSDLGSILSDPPGRADAAEP